MKNPMRYRRYSLAAFLVFCTVAGPVIGLTVKRIWFREQFAVIHPQSDFRSAAIMRIYGSQREVMFVVIVPDGNGCELSTTANPEHKPIPSGIDISPHGPYFNGRRVPIRDGQKVFVWSKNKTLENVILTPKELEKLDEFFVRDIRGNSKLMQRILTTGGWVPSVADKTNVTASEGMRGG